jgi:hypothetical protein
MPKLITLPIHENNTGKINYQEWKNKFYEGYSLYDIKVTDYQKISNRKEIWIIELKK